MCHVLVAIHESVLVLQKMYNRQFGSPGYSALLLHSVWTAFFDRCSVKLPTGEYVSPQYGGSWTLERLDESSSLVHYPTTIIALNRTIRDGVSYVSFLTPIPEEWLVERDWYIVNHWEDQFCRDVYQDLCQYAEVQHLRASSTCIARHNSTSVSSGQIVSETTLDSGPLCLALCAQPRLLEQLKLTASPNLESSRQRHHSLWVLVKVLTIWISWQI